MGYRAMIWAESPEGVIGVGGRIPWHYPADSKRFKRLTRGTTVVMGRTTFESIGRPLPERRNVVVTGRPLDVAGVERATSLDEALAIAGDADVWFIGGARIYAEAMEHAHWIDVTYVPDRIDAVEAVRAPAIDARLFSEGPLLAHEDDARLQRRVYTRRRG
jgi:dihydrofolate reductase